MRCVARVLGGRLGPVIAPADPVEVPAAPEPAAPVVEAPVVEAPVPEAPAAEAPMREAPVLVEATTDPEPDPVPTAAPITVADPAPARLRPSPPPPKRDPPDRKPTGRRAPRPVIAAAIALLAVAGVGTALALGDGGGGSGDKTVADPTTTSSRASTAPVTTAATSTATTAAASSSTTTPAVAEHKTDHPKAGWAPTSPETLFAFAGAPQDGVVDYDVPGKLRYRIVVHAHDLVVDVRFPSGAYEREWTRFKDHRLVRACLKLRGQSYACGASAAALVSPTRTTATSFRCVRGISTPWSPTRA